MKLVIVESKAKCTTIQKILGKEFIVLSCGGHIERLSSINMGIDIANNFKMFYILMDKKIALIENLKKIVLKVDFVYLATDDDREGEFIAFSLKKILNLKENYSRIIFREITIKTILKSIKQEKFIDLKRVESRDVRRCYDRIIGFKLSPILWKLLFSNKESVGRVQSTILIEIFQREMQSFFSNFKIISSFFLKSSIGNFKIPFNKRNFSKFNFKKKIIFKKHDLTFKEGIISGNKYSPLETSSLQAKAFSKYNFNLKLTNKIAQELYEGIKIDDKIFGLITYLRTDSIRLSSEFIVDSKNFILKKYSEKIVYKSILNEKQKLTIEAAHEAIRPTKMNLFPDKIKKFLSLNQFKLYSLIYMTTLASLIKPPLFKIRNYSLKIDEKTNLFFTLRLKKILEQGYLKLKYFTMGLNIVEKFPLFNEIKFAQFFSKKISVEQKLKRYNLASLVKFMKKEGIGRPSTYAVTIEKLKRRNYLRYFKGKIYITKKGILVSFILSLFFKELFILKFTSNMEKSLDLVKCGLVTKLSALQSFYKKFLVSYDNFLKRSLVTNFKIPLKKKECSFCFKENLEIKMKPYGFIMNCNSCQKNVKFGELSNFLLLTNPILNEEIIAKILKFSRINLVNRSFLCNLCCISCSSFLFFYILKKDFNGIINCFCLKNTCTNKGVKNFIQFKLLFLIKKLEIFKTLYSERNLLCFIFYKIKRIKVEK